MLLKALWKPFLVYTGILGLLTVGTVYVTTHSGLYILVLAVVGLLLVVLGGGTAGPMSAAGAEHAEETGAGLEATSLWPRSATDSSFRVLLLLYGLGVFLWCLVVLLTVRDTLV